MAPSDLNEDFVAPHQKCSEVKGWKGKGREVNCGDDVKGA
jgi:hypothetical protein